MPQPFCEVKSSQITGNSGGPVYDQHANLIGVVTAKLPPIRGADPGNDIHPENVNFAIRAESLVDIC